MYFYIFNGPPRLIRPGRKKEGKQEKDWGAALLLLWWWVVVVIAAAVAAAAESPHRLMLSSLFVPRCELISPTHLCTMLGGKKKKRRYRLGYCACMVVV